MTNAIISAPEALAAVEAGQMLLVDIRTPPEWAHTGVAKGARLLNVQHPQGADGFINELLEMMGGDRNAPVALICRTGARTRQVQQYLQQAAGFTQVLDVNEGMVGSASGPGWLRRGLPVEAWTP
jgi:rhodanese-related sulfurtransferase